MGCSKIEKVVLLANFIHQFLPDAQMIVHRDRDYLPEETIVTLTNKLQRNGIYLWATPTVDVEAIFVYAQHIKTVYPGLDLLSIQTMISDAQYETREDSIRRFVNYVSTNISNQEDYPDFRAINLECEQKYNAAPERYSYGKKTFGIIKQKLQSVLHQNPQLIVESQELSQQPLRDLLET